MNRFAQPRSTTLTRLARSVLFVMASAMGTAAGAQAPVVPVGLVTVHTVGHGVEFEGVLQAVKQSTLSALTECHRQGSARLRRRLPRLMRNWPRRRRNTPVHKTCRQRGSSVRLRWMWQRHSSNQLRRVQRGHWLVRHSRNWRKASRA